MVSSTARQAITGALLVVLLLAVIISLALVDQDRQGSDLQEKLFSERFKMLNESDGEETTGEEAILNERRSFVISIAEELPPALQGSVNSSIDPCNDFYQFSCGTWITQVPLPANIQTPPMLHETL